MNYPPQSTHPTSNYPLTNILNPGENDILCGRGGGTNAHSGNIKFRKLVAAHKLRYLAASKSDKPNVARDVVKEWRGMIPPGRFLAKMDVKMMISLNLITVEEIKEEAQLQQQQDGGGGGGNSAKTKKKEKVFWYDVGDKKAREKASQCLRERNGAANEAVAALVKTVTANGEACPEDYATLMSKAAKLKEAQQGQDGGFGMQQQQQQQMNMYGGGGGGMGGYGGGGGNGGNMGGGGYGGGMTNMGGGNVGYCEPVVSGGNGINNVGGGGVGSGSAEDDMIEAEIQRLLREKQEQKMMMGGGGGNHSNNNNDNMGGRGGGGSNNNLNAHNNFGYGGDVQPYMGEESVLREYQALIQKQQELDARLASAKVMMSQQQQGNNNNNGGGGGGGMMSAPYNTNNMGGMMGGGGGSHYGNHQQQQQQQQAPFMQDSPQSMSPNNPNPNAARDYMNRLRMLRQGNHNIDLPLQYNNGMPENVQSSSGSMNNMGGGGNGMNNMNMANMGGGGSMNMGGSNGIMNHNMGGGSNGMNTMGGGNMGGGGGGVNSQKEFSIEEYQASLQEFLYHDDGTNNSGGGGGGRQHSMASQATQSFNNTSNAAYAAAGSAEAIKVPTNLNDGNRRSYTRRNSDRSVDDIDLPIGRNTFKSVDSDERPSFQSMDDVGIGGIRDTFRSVDTMDLMSIGASLNEIVEEDIKNDSEQRKKNSRRLSATSLHSRYARGAAPGGAATLSDYAHLPGATVEVKTMNHGQGGGGGPKKIKKAIDPRLVAMAGRDSGVRGTKSSMLSQDLNLEGIDDNERMSFGNFSIMSGLTDFGDDIDVSNVKGLGGDNAE